MLGLLDGITASLRYYIIKKVSKLSHKSDICRIFYLWDKLIDIE